VWAIRITIAYEPEARYREIDQLPSEVFPEPCAWEIVGDLLTTARSVQKAICLLSEAGTPTYTLRTNHIAANPAGDRSKQMFGRRLREMRPHIELGQRSFAGRRSWVYGGIALRDRADGETKA
jgi:hypothetical protein